MERKNILLQKSSRPIPEPSAPPEVIDALVKGVGQNAGTNSMVASPTNLPTNQPTNLPESPAAAAMAAAPEQTYSQSTERGVAYAETAPKERWVVTAYKLRESTQERVNRLSRITGKSKGEIVDEALRDYIAKVKRQGPTILEL